MNNLNIIFRLFFIVVLLLSLTNSLHAQTKIKLLQYNVFEGFKGDTLIQNEYITWVKEISPDIIAYQEMNGFTQKKLENFALKYGHKYAILSKTDGYPVALTSNFPIVNVQKITDNMQHSYIYANTANLHIFVIHFSPHQLSKRQSEIRQILAHAALLPQKDKIIITGDFNSLSPRDSTIYDREKLEAYKKYEFEHKYIRNLNDGNFDYSVIQLLEKAGYKDLFAIFNKGFVQSSVNSRQRIDFMFGNKKLSKCALSNEVIINDKTQKLSDHYPSIGIFNLKVTNEY